MQTFLKSAALFLPLTALAANPAIHMPFENAPAVFNANGEKIADGKSYGKVTYVDGVVGKGIDVGRESETDSGIVHFIDMPVRQWGQGTIAFWFKPHWMANQPGEKWILVSATKPKGFTAGFLKRADQKLEFSTWASGQIQLLTDTVLDEEKWNHIALSWNAASGNITLYINGKPVASQNNTTKLKGLDQAKAFSIKLGDQSYDLKTVSSSNGVYDEIDIYDNALSDEEILRLSRKSEK